MKHLMVAGCSFSAPSITCPGTAWSEVLAERLGWRLTNLARQGCSNGGVRIQIDEILRQRPDFAIITPTFADRMEVPVDDSTHYDRTAGIDNVNYGTNDYRMICETMFSLAENLDHHYRRANLPRHQQEAVKQYINFIYDPAWKQQMDEWIIKHGIFELFHAGIKFLLVPALLWRFDNKNPSQWHKLFNYAIPSQYVMTNEEESVLPITGNNPFDGEDPGYHGNARSQQIIAENYYIRMISDFNL